MFSYRKNDSSSSDDGPNDDQSFLVTNMKDVDRTAHVNDPIKLN